MFLRTRSAQLRGWGSSSLTLLQRASDESPSLSQVHWHAQPPTHTWKQILFRFRESSICLQFEANALWAYFWICEASWFAFVKQVYFDLGMVRIFWPRLPHSAATLNPAPLPQLWTRITNPITACAGCVGILHLVDLQGQTAPLLASHSGRLVHGPNLVST